MITTTEQKRKQILMKLYSASYHSGSENYYMVKDLTNPAIDNHEAEMHANRLKSENLIETEKGIGGNIIARITYPGMEYVEKNYLNASGDGSGPSKPPKP